MKKKVLFVSPLLLAYQLAYGGSGSGKITQIMVHSSSNGAGVVMFRTENNSNKATCSTAGGGSEWAVSLIDEQGKAMYSLLLSAQAQQKTIHVAGADDCSHWADRERPKFIYF